MPEAAFPRDRLLSEAKFLADLLLDNYTAADGGLFERIDPVSGEILSKRCAVDELGDYIQYIILLGGITGDEEIAERGVGIILDLFRNYGSPKGLLFDRASGNPLRKRLLSTCNADTITGLVSSYLYRRDERLAAAIERFIEGTLDYFERDGYLFYGYLLGGALPVRIASLIFTGYFIEEALTYMRSVDEMRFLPGIERIIEANLKSGYFAEHGILQARIPLGLHGLIWRAAYRLARGDRLERTFLVKDNIYFLFALLEYFRVKRDGSILKRIIPVRDRLRERFTSNGLLHNTWSPSEGLIGGPSGLALSHSLIEFDIDLYLETGKERFLDDARRDADEWLERRSGPGVVAESPAGGRGDALLDPNVDLAVNLFKLNEITGDDKYLDAASGIIDGIIRYFRCEHGYRWSIDAEAGEPGEDMIETKFLGLLMKLFLIGAEVQGGRSILTDPILRNLAKDR